MNTKQDKHSKEENEKALRRHKMLTNYYTFLLSMVITAAAFGAVAVIIKGVHYVFNQ